MTQTSEEILTGAWDRVCDVKPPVNEPPGVEWHFAAGALWALGTAGVLDDDAITRWEATAQAEAKRLGASGPDSPAPPEGTS